ncbi:Ig-like domain-containing protein [Enterobacter bugandensis]|uniref:Ig-like domain-containing protein n=1 Tax=Enterobacter bugandensis TaxID=881260 RepID=UPI0021CE1CCF|nr:Ig-like domain-containing protein [Enterobacter bugandensis]
MLEYRKKEVIRLKTAGLVTGYAGEQKSLGVSVNSKYGLKHIDWDAGALTAAGGSIVQSGNDWTVTLPAWQAAGVNSYTVSGVAVDAKGNRSQRSTTQVTVTQAAIDPLLSTLSPTEITLPADGKTSQELELRVVDKDGSPVDISADEIALERVSRQRGTSSAVVTGFTRKTAGEYVAVVTAGTRPESFTLTPSARNARFSSSSVLLVADTSTALIDSLSVLSDNAVADGKTQNQIKAVVVDAQNNPVQGQIVTLRADHDATLPESVVSDAKGEAVIPVSSTRAGNVTVAATINGNGEKSVRVNFLPDQGSAAIAERNLTVTPDVSLADGKTPKAVRALVTDAKGNPVTDMVVTFSADNGATLSEKSTRTDDSGIARTSITSTVAGQSRVTASVNNSSASRTTTFAGNSATASIASVEPTEKSGTADGKTPVTFRAQVLDTNGNKLSGVPVDWHSNKDNVYVTFQQAQTISDENGIASALVTSKKAYRDVVVTASTNASSRSSEVFTFVADRNNAAISALTSDRTSLTADGKDLATLTVKVVDANDNPLSGVSVTLTNDEGAQIAPQSPVTGEDGTATATVKTAVSGNFTVRAQLQNGQQRSITLNALADVKSATIKLMADVSEAIAGQSKPVTLTATVTDASNNPVPDTSVAWQTDRNSVSSVVSVTDASGKASVELSGTQAGVTTVTGVLYNGNKASAQVTFGSAEPAGQHSSLTVSPQTVTADGKSVATAMLLLKDEWGNPVSGKNILWKADSQSGIHFTPEEQGNGIYQAKVIGTQEGSWMLSASVGDVRLQTSLGLLASQETAEIESVKLTGPDSVKANGSDTVTFQAQVKDEKGNSGVKGVAVGWDTTLGQLPSRLSHTDENGVATITLSSKQAGQAKVTAMLGGSAPVVADKLATFTAGDISAADSRLTVSPATVTAGMENTTVTVEARDVEGNPLSGFGPQISLHYSTDLDMSPASFAEVAPGQYKAAITGKRAGQTEISADINDTTVSNTVILTVREDNASAIVKGDISVTPSSAITGEYVTYAAVLTDKFGNPLGAGIPVTWSANDGSLPEAQVTKTDETGTARVRLTRLKAGTASVQLILSSGSVSAPDVTFSAGSVEESRTEVTLAPSVITAGKEQAILDVILRDKNGNLISGQKVTGQPVEETESVSVSDSREISSGHYSMSVSGARAGQFTLAVSVNGSRLTQTKTLTVRGNTDNWTLTGVTVNKTSLRAGDTAGVTYSAQVKDGLGNILPGVVVSWQLKGDAESFEPTSRTNDQGIAVTTVRSNTAGLLNMTAYLDGKNHLDADAVRVVPAEVDNTRSTFTADKNSIGSDGKDAVTFRVHLEDKFGNPVPEEQVSIKGAEALTGFTLGSVVPDGEGNYLATGVSTEKGEVTLHATTGNITVGQPIRITVGAITPDLRFPNALQVVSWTKNFTASQTVQGMPDGVKQVWSSSDDTIATVNNTGKVSLLRAGEVSISVYTPGNAQYNPAMASYHLKISKAQPKLAFGAGEHQTVYGSSFTLPAVASGDENIDLNDLKVTFSSSDPSVSSVDNAGKIKMLKAGSVKFYARNAETDQFEASQAEYVLVIAKAKLPITFSESLKKVNMQQMAANPKTYWQAPEQQFPEDATVEVQSSNETVLKVKADGSVENYSPGATRVKLTVKEDERYESSAGDYDLNVYGRPVMSVSSIQGTSLGKLTDVTSQDWQPYFVNDELQIDWSSKVDPYYLPEKVVVSVLDGNNVLAEQSYEKGAVSSGKTKIKAQASWVDKTLTVSVRGYGFAGTESDTTTRTVNTSVVDIRKIIASATAALKHDVYIAAEEVKDNNNTCRTTKLVKQRDVYLNSDVNIVPLYPSEVTLFEHDIVLYIDNYTRTNDGNSFSWTREMGSVGGNGSLRFQNALSGINKNSQLVEDCWANHAGGMDDQGRVSATVKVSYAGKTFTLRSADMTWSGDSGSSNQSNVNLTVQ